MAIMRNFGTTEYYKCWLYFNLYFNMLLLFRVWMKKTTEKYHFRSITVNSYIAPMPSIKAITFWPRTL
jgi:hypothetical protein